MRTTAKVPHPKMDISVFLRENYYIIKIVHTQYEQVYRIKASDVIGMDDVLAMCNAEFLNNVYMRFVDMSKDFKVAFQQINTIQKDENNA